MRWALEIPGAPVAKGRPRMARQGTAYTPAKTRRYEDVVRQLAAAARPPLFEGPVRVTVIATIEPPRSWSKRKTAAHLGRPHCQRPDADNLAKAVTDALNRIVWHDDAQIWSLTVRKEWGRPARVTVLVDDDERDAWEDVDSPMEACHEH